MRVNTTDLIKVSTYARRAECSVQYVYKLIKEGKLKEVKIDDTIFIMPAKNESNGQV
jgi:hypothetical protein